MKKPVELMQKKPSAGSRIIASLKEAVDWVEGKEIAVRVTTVEVPVILNPAVGQAGAACDARIHCASKLLGSSPNG